MSMIRLFIIIWLLIWLLCSVTYILSSVSKAKEMGTKWSFKKNLSHLSSLLITWPFVIFIYVYAKIKFRGKTS
ncbi:Uncharacterized protein dnm_067550 [Desulfonema magnum]|uniref:Uncharacterized protein n=1 Tax=Desulfonema magnum TaxID=45655 RepID=A0A975BRU1_9BACT|nr:Uncharacterized protein dnm_067550 [Desulfonema magnum]